MYLILALFYASLGLFVITHAARMPKEMRETQAFRIAGVLLLTLAIGTLLICGVHPR
jgi:hypothetical protein